MERVREPGAQGGKEIRAELEHSQAELAATRRKIQQLEQAVAAKASQAQKWAERTQRQPRQSVPLRVALLLGACLGAALAAGVFQTWGTPPPEQPPVTRPNWIPEPQDYSLGSGR